jgi:hypothetical protein
VTCRWDPAEMQGNSRRLPGEGAHGEGDSREAAIADLREALIGLIAEFGAPDELTLMLDVA